MSRLHWYGPRSYPERWHVGIPPLRRARYRLYVPEEQYTGRQGSRYHRDRNGAYVWMGTDCGWEWLETRPLIRSARPLRWLFGRLHEHVHTAGSW